MVEETTQVAVASANVFLQYGAIGVIALVLMFAVFYMGRKLIESVLTALKDIHDIMISIKLIADTTAKNYNETIEHERDRNEGCYDKVVHSLGELKVQLTQCGVNMQNTYKDINVKLDNMEKHSIKCHDCVMRITR